MYFKAYKIEYRFGGDAFGKTFASNIFLYRSILPKWKTEKKKRQVNSKTEQ